MRTGDLVGSLDDDEHKRLLSVMETAEADPGAVILHREAPSRSLILVEDGELEVVEDAAGGPVVLGVIGPGEAVGDVGFVDGAPRTHDVRARTRCKLRRLPRTTLMELSTADPVLFGKVAMGLAHLLARRFRGLVDELGPMRAYVLSLADPEEGDIESFDALDDSSEPLELLRGLADKANRNLAGL
jgi:CRP-like cAMP-binding protein